MNDVTVGICWREDTSDWEWSVLVKSGRGFKNFTIEGGVYFDSVPDAIRDATNALESLGVGIKKIEVQG